MVQSEPQVTHLHLALLALVLAVSGLLVPETGPVAAKAEAARSV